jgi:hypothetical protein
MTLLKLNDLIEELIDLAVAKGMSRRNAKREIAKLVEEHWQSGKIDIYGRRNDKGPLEVVPRDPDLQLVVDPVAKSH